MTVVIGARKIAHQNGDFMLGGALRHRLPVDRPLGADEWDNRYVALRA
jgi:hypothetical protein